MNDQELLKVFNQSNGPDDLAEYDWEMRNIRSMESRNKIPEGFYMKKTLKVHRNNPKYQGTSGVTWNSIISGIGRMKKKTGLKEGLIGEIQSNRKIREKYGFGTIEIIKTTMVEKEEDELLRLFEGE